MRRPARRSAAAAGMTMTTRPPGSAWLKQCWTQASSGSPRGGSPCCHRRSVPSSSCPQARSPKGGSHTTAPNRRPGKPSARRESPTANSTTPPSAMRRAAAMRQVAAFVSCPASRVAPRDRAAASRPPMPQAGSRTVRPDTAARSATSSASASGVVGTRRAVASWNRPIRKRRVASGSLSAASAPTRRSAATRTGSIASDATAGNSGTSDESDARSARGNSSSAAASSCVHAFRARTSSTSNPPSKPTASSRSRSST